MGKKGRRVGGGVGGGLGWESGRVVGGWGWLFVAKGGVRVLGLSFIFLFFFFKK